MSKIDMVPQNFKASLKKNPARKKILAAAILLATAALFGSRIALARQAPQAAGQASVMHPAYTLLDDQGLPVIQSGKPVSTMQTCGACHDTEFIAGHSDHAMAGLDEMTQPGEIPSGRAWDTGTGLFGKWDPINYRYLSPAGDDKLDMSTAEWIIKLGARHAGGGPATTSRDGQPLTTLQPDASNPEASILDPKTGEAVSWDWKTSGTVEMNCFLCHSPQPNSQARAQALESGDFGWANTATLLGTGIVEQSGETFSWNPDAFNSDGELKPEFVAIQDPTDQNCGVCHGLVHSSTSKPLIVAGCSVDSDRTATTGQIISPERISESGMNLAGKSSLDRSWDVHAERQVSCTDCHYSLNNPVYYQGSSEDQPDYLSFDPRRLEIGEYLKQPLHQFARGDSAQNTAAPELQDTMRPCESCHSIEATHNWLPYKSRHVDVLSCETCHVPKIYSPAYQQYDWTSVQADASPLVACRGLQGPNGSISSLVTGYEPALLPKVDGSGGERLAPFNLVTSWFWVYGDPQRPVRQQDLKAAWLDGGQYRPEIVAAFDKDGDGTLNAQEAAIDTPERQSLIAARLEKLGLQNPHIVGEVQPYSINHDVVAGEDATKDCSTCHTGASRLGAPILLASYAPGGVMPEFVNDSGTTPSGEIYKDERGALWYQPQTQESGVYVLGHNSVGWVDLLGSLLFVGILVGVGSHATLRYLSARRATRLGARHKGEIEPVYMYSVYERFWHWLQTFTILGLLFTGLIIHKPDTFGIFSFRGVVAVHNILAAILLINAFLSLFYHLASGEIQQYIPRPYGFIDDMISQALFYLKGIFKGEPHPFEKTPKNKLNPLQKVTYFTILNILLPLQILTGALMWGVQRWPEVVLRLGGLPYLAPFHTLIAWLFAGFIVAHVYLTTTGHAPFAGIKSMMVGWDELEIAQPTLQQEESQA